MRDMDQAARQRLAQGGERYEGHAREMRELQERFGARLVEMIDQLGGWPTPDLVGEDGSAAAWLICQHAISMPELQRRCLALLKPLAARGVVPRKQFAYLLDRIRMFEGRPQVYGTQFVWDERGELVPHPIEDPEHVEERRAFIGLPSLREHARQVRETAGPPPRDVEAWRRDAETFARTVGWREVTRG